MASIENKLNEAMEQYTEHLLRLAFFYTRNHQTAEDIVQEVFVKYFYGKYEERGQLKPYLVRITINQCKDYLKSWAYRKIQLKDHWSKLTKKDTNHLVIDEERSIIGEAILKLAIAYREPIILYYFEEMTVSEISFLLRMPENTVKTRLKRAREQLKPHLQGDWEVLSSE